MNKIFFQVGLILSLLIINDCNAQVSLCTDEERTMIIKEILHKGDNTPDEESSSSLKRYLKSLTGRGIQMLKNDEDVVVLKIYNVRALKRIETPYYYLNFNDWFQVDSPVSYLFFKKNAIDEYHDAGEYNMNPEGVYEYSYSNQGINEDRFIDSIINNENYKNAILIYFYTGKGVERLCLIQNGILYKPALNNNDFESEEEEIEWLNKWYNEISKGNFWVR